MFKLFAFQSTLSSRRATISPWTELDKSEFQSTLSSRRATCPLTFYSNDKEISIHALLTESDERLGKFRQTLPNFNPRSPHGERRLGVPHLLYIDIFQSTLSSRRATETRAP